MFYENFERVCAERDVKPARACVMAGLGQNRSSNWKKTGALPKEDELAALARALDCSVADFFDDGPLRDPASLNDYERTLLECFDRLSPMDQADVLVYARNLCAKREREGARRL